MTSNKPRWLLAELELLEQYDRRRQFAGHDYGCGQRGAELSRRRRELESFYSSELPPVARPELRAAFERIGRPRLERLRLSPGGRQDTPSSRRSIRTWERLARAIGATLEPELVAEPDESAGLAELGPGERIVDGEVRYSARWLDGPKLVVAGVVAALGLLAASPATASPIVPPPSVCSTKPYVCIAHPELARPLCAVKPYLCRFLELPRPWLETYPAPCTLRRPCPFELDWRLSR